MEDSPGNLAKAAQSRQSVSQPPRGTGDLTEPGSRAAPSLGSEGKKVAGKSVI